jgi:hypothetical protein
MEKKFRILRIIGTMWKVLAWVALISGVLASLGLLLVGVLGSGGFMLRLFGQEPGMMPGAEGVVSSVLGFIVGLIGTIIYFLILYAVGELIYLLLAIEENTRQTLHVMQRSVRTGTEPPASPPPSPP